MAQPVASRRRTQQSADADDVFVARAVEFTEWARRNVWIVVGIALVILLLVGGVIFYRMQQAEQRAAAAAEFMHVEQTAAAGNIPLAIRDLETFIQRYGGTVYGDEARVLLGRLYMETGEPERAIPVLEEVARRIGRSPVGPQGGLLLGAAQEQAGNPAAAIESYLRVGREAPLEVHRQDALSSAALLREQAGDYGGAAQLYAELVEITEEGTLERSIYEMRLAEAESRALTAQ